MRSSVYKESIVWSPGMYALSWRITFANSMKFPNCAFELGRGKYLRLSGFFGEDVCFESERRNPPNSMLLSTFKSVFRSGILAILQLFKIFRDVRFWNFKSVSVSVSVSEKSRFSVSVSVSVLDIILHNRVIDIFCFLVFDICFFQFLGEPFFLLLVTLT